MAFVPGFEHDVFVSYAHFDNEPDTQEIRWVSRFQADLKVALRQRLGVDPDIFFDNRSLQNQFLDELTQNARGAAAFIAIMSPSYMKREWTIKELEAFHSNNNDQNRLVPVELLPVLESECHPRLLQVKRAPFYWKDPLEEDIALKLTPKFNPDKYEQRLQGLAHRMEALLRSIRDRSPKPVDVKGPLSGETILLAQVTNDLYDERDQVVAYLNQFGAKILPEADYKQGGPEFAEAFKADLAQAGLFVQLLGPYRSNRPPDLLAEGSTEPRSYAQFQYDTAKATGKPVLQWRRPDINPATITHWDKRLLDGPEVLVMGLQEFMKEIKKSIERKNAAAEKEKAKAEKEAGKEKSGDGAAKTPVPVHQCELERQGTDRPIAQGVREQARLDRRRPAVRRIGRGHHQGPRRQPGRLRHAAPGLRQGGRALGARAIAPLQQDRAAARVAAAGEDHPVRTARAQA